MLFFLLFSLFPWSVAQQWVDPDTETAALQRRSFRSGLLMDLVASDEYQTEGRSFAPGKDKMFEALHQPDETNNAMQFYDPEYVTTNGGFLEITTRAEKVSWQSFDNDSKTYKTLTRNYTSGMVQSWNKFCFTGGILEVSVQLPGGNANAGGLWPAAWLMGNLARATFPKSTMSIWPWSYDKCGEIPDLEYKQEISACDPSPGHGMHPHQGRGSPEVDIFEVMLGHSMPGKNHIPAFMSSSLQVAPGIDGRHRPKNGHRLNSSTQWYKDLQMSDSSEFNYGFWGQMCGPEVDNSVHHKYKYRQDAISVNTDLNDSHFQEQHIYRIEWEPSANSSGYLEWYLDGELIFSIAGKSLEVTGAQIPLEPMYLILNTAVSHSWGFPEPCDTETCSSCYHCYDCTNPECQCSLPAGMKNCANLPATMKVDFIRLYQDKHNSYHTMSCSPPQYPTETFIAHHKDRYTSWDSSKRVRPVPHSTGRYKFLFALSLLAIIALVAVAIDCVMWNSQLVRHITSSLFAYKENRSGDRSTSEMSPLMGKR